MAARGKAASNRTIAEEDHGSLADAAQVMRHAAHFVHI